MPRPDKNFNWDAFPSPLIAMEKAALQDDLDQLCAEPQEGDPSFPDPDYQPDDDDKPYHHWT